MRTTRTTLFVVAIAISWSLGCAASPRGLEELPVATSGLEASVRVADARAAAHGNTAKQSAASPSAPAATCQESSLPVMLSTLQRVSGSARLVVDRATLPSVSQDAIWRGDGIEVACPILTVTTDAVVFDGAPVAGADDAARASAITALWRTAQRRRPRPTTLCVAAPPQLPLARVEALVGRLPRVVLIAVAPPSRPATGSAWAEQTIRAIEAAPAAGRCAAYGDALERAAGSCEPARAALRTLIATTPACTATPTAGAGVNESRGVTDALAGCHCGGADSTAIIRLYERAADRVGSNLRAFPLHGDLEPGAGLEAAVAGTAVAPVTVLDRVRALERQSAPRRD